MALEEKQQQIFRLCLVQEQVEFQEELIRVVSLLTY